MKILFILDLYKPHIWGVEILFENLINWLIEKWHKVKILTSKFNKELAKYEILENWVEVYRVGHNRYDFMFYCFNQWISLAHRADIIHTTTYNSAIPTSIIGKISHKKVVLTVHEIFGKLRYKFMGRKWFFFKLFENLIFKFHFDKYICVSNYTKNCLRIQYGIEDSKLTTIYNGIDYKLWNRDSFTEENIETIREKYNLNKHYTWLFFGRPWISKGLSVYLDAIPDIIKKIPNFVALLIVSESQNNIADRERKIIDALHIKKHIIWIPGVKYNELWNYILASDCVVVPSLAEGFGFAAAEVCALDKELVVSNIASLPEVVSWKVNFVESGNSSDIALKVIDLYNKKYKKIHRKDFLWETNIKKTLAIYGETINHK